MVNSTHGVLQRVPSGIFRKKSHLGPLNFFQIQVLHTPKPSVYAHSEITAWRGSERLGSEAIHQMDPEARLRFCKRMARVKRL